MLSASSSVTRKNSRAFGRFGGGFGRFFSAGILFIAARLFGSARLIAARLFGSARLIAARLFGSARLIAAGGDGARVALIVCRRAGSNAEDAGNCHYKA